MSKNDVNTSTALEKPDTIESLLDVDGDPGPEPNLPPHVVTFLGEQLQACYARLTSEPVPARFVQLLEQLDRKGSGDNDD